MVELDLKKQAKKKLPGHWNDIENSVTAGMPDTIVRRNGRLQWIEFKRNYNGVIILRPLQRVWFIREINDSGQAWIMFDINEQPAIISGLQLIHREYAIKGGKLHYAIDQFDPYIGWPDIDSTLFQV